MQRCDSSRLLARAARWSLVGLVLIVLTGLGWNLRIALWDFTAGGHYEPDMGNAYRWGGEAHGDGREWAYVNLYEDVLDQANPERYGLDYVPLRLWVMKKWVGWTRDRFPEARGWHEDYIFNAPLLRLNAVMELAASLCAAGIVLVWLRRVDCCGGGGGEAGPVRGKVGSAYRYWVLPLIAFCLVWFNPAGLVSAHVRPTWDVWVLPFFLGAVLCAMLEGWFLAGVLVGVGAMFKGQQFIVAPLFVIWPILMWRWGAAARAVIGCAVAVGVVVSPWMLTYQGGVGGERVVDWMAAGWIGASVFAVIVVIGIRFWTPWLSMRWKWVAGVLAGLVVLIPAMIARPDLWMYLIPSAVALVAALALLSLRKQAFVLAAVAGFGLLSCMFLFHGSDAWFEIAFRYGGMVKYPQLEVGGSSSLAGILQNSYGWKHDQVVFTWNATDVTIHQLLLWIFAGLMVLSIAGVAIQYVRKSERFLIAIATPWVLFFAVAPLMHERYLLWGAVVAACSIGAGWGPALLGIFLSGVSWIMSVNQIMRDGDRLAPAWWPTLGQDIIAVIRPTHPGIGWAVLIAAGVFLYLSVVPGQRRHR